MNGPRWYEGAMEKLEQELNDGLISHAEFNAEMRELNWELRDEAAENARDAYNNTFGDW